MVRKINIFLSIAIVLGGIIFDSPRASALCTSQKCKDAAAAEEAAREKASNAESAANTLADEVERLNSEIAMYEARIATNIATAEDLSKEIEENLDSVMDDIAFMCAVGMKVVVVADAQRLRR